METVIFEKCGSAYISSRIEEAINDQSRTATISGNWEIDEAIRLPSNFTLILKDAHLRMSDGVYSNMFVNEHHGTDIGNTLDGTDRNINILGCGSAILDGGKYNGLSEKITQRTDCLRYGKTIFFCLQTLTALRCRVFHAAINVGGR